MKYKLITMAVGLAMFVAGLLCGGFIQNTKTGYHSELLERKEYKSDLGPIEWSRFVESVGFQVLDTDKTMINLGNRTLYKAQRDFQENDPYARNIEVVSNMISWEDGDYQFHLSVIPMRNDKSAVTAK